MSKPALNIGELSSEERLRLIEQLWMKEKGHSEFSLTIRFRPLAKRGAARSGLHM